MPAIVDKFDRFRDPKEFVVAPAETDGVTATGLFGLIGTGLVPATALTSARPEAGWLIVRGRWFRAERWDWYAAAVGGTDSMAAASAAGGMKGASESATWAALE